MEKCERCGFEGEFVTEEYRDSKLIFCPDCYHHRTEHCEHQNKVLIRYETSIGLRVQYMCKDCLSLFGNAVKQDGLNLNSLKLIDKGKYDKWREDQDEAYRKRSAKLFELHSEWLSAQCSKKHQDYLKTIEWQEKRDEVLRRDNFTCQSCLKKRATQVHHLTYDHFGSEPLFDLISVCDECHQMISEMDEKKKNQPSRLTGRKLHQPE